MAKHNDTGNKGEEIAVDYLKGNGYFIKERNWRFGKNEIDVIASDGKELAIVEVKTRSSRYLVEPFTAVTRTKQKLLIRAANAYVKRVNYCGDVRFDVISIILFPDSHELEHMKNAFYPLMR